MSNKDLENTPLMQFPSALFSNISVFGEILIQCLHYDDADTVHRWAKKYTMITFPSLYSLPFSLEFITTSGFFCLFFSFILFAMYLALILP